MRILKLLLLLLLFLFPFGELLRLRLTDAIVVKPLDVTAGLIALTILMLLLKKEIRIVPKIHYIAFPIVGAIALLLNSLWIPPDDLFAASLYLIRWMSYAAIAVAVIAVDASFRKKLLWFMVVDGLLIVLLGYVQYFFYQSLVPLYPFGWDDHMYRMFSVFLDPNFAGGFFVLYIFLIASSLYGLTKQKNQKEKKQIAALLFIGVLTFIAILLTFSRSTLAMLIVGTIVMLVLIRQKKLIGLLFGILTLFVILISPHFNVENINLLREASSKARLENYASAVKIIKDRPIFGVGFNSFRYAKEAYGIPMGWTNKPSHADAGVDNSFLFILATTGVIGLVAYGMLWWGILKRAFERFRKEHNAIALCLIASVVGIAVHSMFLNSLFYAPIVLWFWLLIGLLWSKK